jgi:hypothetical protein
VFFFPPTDILYVCLLVLYLIALIIFGDEFELNYVSSSRWYYDVVRCKRSFIYVFNNAASSADCTALDGRMNNE